MRLVPDIQQNASRCLFVPADRMDSVCLQALHPKVYIVLWTDEGYQLAPKSTRMVHRLCSCCLNSALKINALLTQKTDSSRTGAVSSCQ